MSVKRDDKSIDFRLYLNEATDFDLTRQLGKSKNPELAVMYYVIIKTLKRQINMNVSNQERTNRTIYTGQKCYTQCCAKLFSQQSRAGFVKLCQGGHTFLTLKNSRSRTFLLVSLALGNICSTPSTHFIFHRGTFLAKGVQPPEPPQIQPCSSLGIANFDQHNTIPNRRNTDRLNQSCCFCSDSILGKDDDLVSLDVE